MKTIKNKRQYRYPAISISVSQNDLKVIKELRNKYHINISSFFRDKILELYNEKKK